jgi:murein DD-endopeptidase MepM/ murein hydrolase activator NlpD
MKYPIKDWKTAKRGYKFGVPTSYSDFHLGEDHIVPQGTQVVAPTDGRVVGVMYGKQGGNTVWFKMNNGKLVRFLHLSAFKCKMNQVMKEGQVLALTGNTGLSTGPHLHTDVSKNGHLELNNHANFEDPDVTFQLANVYAVDTRYGLPRDVFAEAKMRANVWLINKIKRQPTQRELNGLVYGRWEFQAVFQNSVGEKWLNHVK